MKTWSTPVQKYKTEIVPCVLCGGTVFLPALQCEGYSFVRCRKCGLVQMKEQPTKEEIIARYGSAHGKDYLKYELENEDNFLKLQQLALKQIKIRGGRGEGGRGGVKHMSDTDPHTVSNTCRTQTHTRCQTHVGHRPTHRPTHSVKHMSDTATATATAATTTILP